MIYSFTELPPDQRSLAGGKGGALTQLKQGRYPVPDGFVILPSAFEGDTLNPSAWVAVQSKLARLRVNNGQTAFAVRSSALSEDSAQAPFAGEFETVLDVMTPLTWSLLQVYIAESLPFAIPGRHPYLGNVGGRFYLNVSFGAAFFAGFSLSRERLNYELGRYS
jgi:hypothetical protein